MQRRVKTKVRDARAQHAILELSVPPNFGKPLNSQVPDELGISPNRFLCAQITNECDIRDLNDYTGLDSGVWYL